MSFSVDVYDAFEVRPNGDADHIWALITSQGEETYNLDDMDYVLVFRKLRDSLGEEEGEAQAKHYASMLFPQKGVYFYALGDKYEVVTVHHA